MTLHPGPQPIATGIKSTWCATCGGTTQKPHDLVRDCAPELDEQARYAQRVVARRDAVAKVVRERMRQEATRAV